MRLFLRRNKIYLALTISRIRINLNINSIKLTAPALLFLTWNCAFELGNKKSIIVFL